MVDEPIKGAYSQKWLIPTCCRDQAKKIKSVHHIILVLTQQKSYKINFAYLITGMFKLMY